MWPMFCVCLAEISRGRSQCNDDRDSGAVLARQDELRQGPTEPASASASPSCAAQSRDVNPRQRCQSRGAHNALFYFTNYADQNGTGLDYMNVLN